LSEPLKLAVDLLKDSAHQIQTWATRFIALNTAMLTGVGVIVGWSKFETYKWVLLIVITILCLFAAVVSYHLAGITLRQVTWNFEIRERIRALQGDQRILPEEKEVEGGSRNRDFWDMLGVAVPVLWLLLAAVIWIGITAPQ
jgi:hypothetical protein